jgi:uncharacterized protein YkwD
VTLPDGRGTAAQTSVTRRFCLTGLCATAIAFALAPAAPALAAPRARHAHHRVVRLAPVEVAMLAQINAARAAAGLAPVRVATTLQSASTVYARTIIAHDRFAHALGFQRGTGFRWVGEILAMCPHGRADIGAVIRAWLASPEHRPILLGGQFGWAGVAFARGSMGGHPTAIWVVRFGSR